MAQRGRWTPNVVSAFMSFSRHYREFSTRPHKCKKLHPFPQLNQLLLHKYADYAWFLKNEVE